MNALLWGKTFWLIEAFHGTARTTGTGRLTLVLAVLGAG